MKTSLLLNLIRPGLALLLLAVALAALSTQAGLYNPPQVLSYQGYLTDQAGNPLGNTNTGPKNYNVIFRVWNLQTGGTIGGAGDLYAEQQTVTVTSGYFSVLLGLGSQVGAEPHTNQISALFSPTLATPLYVEITVLGIGAGGGNITILPRLQLVSSPYSFLAANAVNATYAANLVNANNTSIVTINNTSVTMAGNVQASGLESSGAFTTHSQGAFLEWNKTGADGAAWLLNERGTGPGGLIFGTVDSANNWVNQMEILANGNVGIGTATPGALLEVNGTLQVDAPAVFNGGINVNSANGYHQSSLGAFSLDAPGVAGGRVNVAASGAVTLGTSSQTAQVTVTGNLAVSGTIAGNGAIPVGGIILWSGSTTAVPTGWALCNGQSVNGQTTPNLTDRFVVGAGNNYSPANTGGNASVTLSVNQIPSHTHGYEDGYWVEASDGNGNYASGGGSDYVQNSTGGGVFGANGDDNDNHYVSWRSMTSYATGGGQPFDNRPPYYALAYIMRVQ